MIKSRKDLQYYIECDMRARDLSHVDQKTKLATLFCPAIWKFQIKLRKVEYYKNCKVKGPLSYAIYCIMKARLDNYGLKLGCSIPLNVFGPGLCINHSQGVIVSGFAKAGSNVRINGNVNIGNYSRFDSKHVEDNAPIIGNNVYIGPGAKIYGNVTIADDIAIGANAVVNKSFRDKGVTIAGVPARIVSHKGSLNMMIYGDKTKEPAMNYDNA